MNELAAADARALVSEIQGLFDREHYGAAISRCDEFLNRFADTNEPSEREQVAWVLVKKGLCLGELGRAEEAIGAYDDLIARDRGHTPGVRKHLAWAYNNKALALNGLGRREQAIATYGELIARYGTASDPKIRLRVSWALWNEARLLEELSRGQEAEAIYDELIARHDEALDAALARQVAWCLESRAWNLGQSGDTGAQLRLCAELLDRFGNAQDPPLRRRVVRACKTRADALARLGRHGEAIAAWDEALALLDGLSGPKARVDAAAVLLSKGQMLVALDRAEEAIVLFDSSVAAYLAAREEGAGTDELWVAVLALCEEAWALCLLERSGAARAVRARLAAVLGDVVEATSGDSDAGHPADAASEASLAAAFADFFNGGDCWRWFEARDEQPAPELMAHRATELYRLIEPWLLAGEEMETGLAALAAAAGLRLVADGYAMLARRWSATERDALPLPQRAESQHERVVRRLRIDEWAAGHGHPLALREPAANEAQADPGDEPLDQGGSAAADFASRDFVRFFLTVVYTYDLLVVLCDSPTGRQAMHSDYLRQYAIRQIADATRWIRWLIPLRELEDEGGAVVFGMLIAEAFFLVSCGAVSSSATLYPGVRIMRDNLREAGICDWLVEQGARLPQWLTEND